MGCLTEADISEFYQEAAGDEQHMMALVNSRRCVPIQHLPYSLVQSGYPFILIRVFVGDDSIKLWTLQSVLAQ